MESQPPFRRPARSGNRQPNRPKPAARPKPPKPPKGPGTFVPLAPSSGKQRRRMLKAAVFRLAHALRMAPQQLLKATPAELAAAVDQIPASRIGAHGRRGKARRLAAKLLRLRA